MRIISSISHLIVGRLRGVKSQSALDERWASSDKSLSMRWQRIAMEFFPNNTDLLNYKIVWSKRSQKRVLGSCNLRKKRVNVARAMDRPELDKHLDALIFHEMCHAVAGITHKENGRRVFHGATFKELERKHPGILELNRWIKEGGWRGAVRSYASHRGSLMRRSSRLFSRSEKKTG